jgi:thioredoxin-related protein
MKKLLFAALPVVVIASMLLKTGEPLPIGATLPKADVKMKDISGNMVSFKDAQKKNGLMVMFTCNTCPVVKKYQARTLEVCKYAIGNDIGVMLLNSNEATREDGDSYDDMKTYGKDQGYYFNYVLDQNSVMADAFGASRTPEIFLFDKNGKLVYHGGIDDNSGDPAAVTHKHAVTAIQELAQGKDISIKTSRSVGCSIKRRG